MSFHPSIRQAARSGDRVTLAEALTKCLPCPRGKCKDQQLYIEGVRNSTDANWLKDQFALFRGGKH